MNSSHNEFPIPTFEPKPESKEEQSPKATRGDFYKSPIDGISEGTFMRANQLITSGGHQVPYGYTLEQLEEDLKNIKFPVGKNVHLGGHQSNFTTLHEIGVSTLRQEVEMILDARKAIENHKK